MHDPFDRPARSKCCAGGDSARCTQLLDGCISRDRGFSRRSSPKWRRIDAAVGYAPLLVERSEFLAGMIAPHQKGSRVVGRLAAGPPEPPSAGYFRTGGHRKVPASFNASKKRHTQDMAHWQALSVRQLTANWRTAIIEHANVESRPTATWRSCTRILKIWLSSAHMGKARRASCAASSRTVFSGRLPRR